MGVSSLLQCWHVTYGHPVLMRWLGALSLLAIRLGLSVMSIHVSRQLALRSHDRRGTASAGLTDRRTGCGSPCVP